MNESDVKREMVKSVKESGGYARRIEDQYGVGVYDLILIPLGLPVFLTEVKMIRGPAFGPTPRQYVELENIRHAASHSGHAIPILIGFRNGVYYFIYFSLTVDPRDCFSVTTTDVNFHDQLVKFYYSRRK